MDKQRESLKGLATVASIGIHLVVATVIGLFVGLYIDKYLSTSPWFMIIFLLFGLGEGFRNIYTVTKKYGFRDDAGDAKK